MTGEDGGQALPGGDEHPLTPGATLPTDTVGRVVARDGAVPP